MTSDSNPGSQTAPWKTIQKAAATAVAGDKIIVRAGIYGGFVTNKFSGTAGAPIVFEGERGPDGEWLTIIDPSTPVTNGWVDAPEIGPGVFKQTNLAFAARELTINHKRVAFVSSIGDISSSTSQAYNDNLTTGAQFLTLAHDATVTSKFSRQTFKWWDGIEALYCSAGSVCFLRLRDGSNPNGLNIRTAPNSNDRVNTSIIYPAIRISNKSFITWRNFKVRGSICCFLIEGSSAHHNIIQSNYLSGGYARVAIVSGANNNSLMNNEITTSYYGYEDPGGWGTDTLKSAYTARENLYIVSKFLMGGSTSYDSSVEISRAGNSNSVLGNHIFKSLGSGVSLGSYVWAADPTISNTVIAGNVIEKHPSIGIACSPGETQTHIYSNLVSDCNVNLRVHQMNDAYETNRIVYVYRNRFWLPDQVGEHIFTHWYSSAGSYRPTFWFYHNSFFGGGAVLVDNGYGDENGGFPNFHYINNIFSGSPYFGGGYSMQLLTNANMMGTFDFNLCTAPWPTYPTTKLPAWFGTNNIRQDTVEWTNGPEFSFVLKARSRAIDSATDVSQPFVLRGITYPALPASGAKKVGPEWDRGAVEVPLEPASDTHIGDPGD